MKPMPTNDVAMPLSATRGSIGRSTDRLNGEATANLRMAELNGGRTSKIQHRFSPDGGEKIDANSGSPRQSATFDLIVEEVDESEATSDVTTAAVMDFTSPQSSALARDIVGLLQSSPTTDTPDAVNVATQSASTDTKSATDLLACETHVVSDDISRLAEQLSARAISLSRASQTATQSAPPPVLIVAEDTDGQAAVSVSQMKEKTGFDAAVKVTASHQSWFQSANPLRNSLVSMAIRLDGKEGSFRFSNDKVTGDMEAASAAPELSADNAVEPLQAFGNQEASDRGNDNAAAREGSRRGLSAEAAIGTSKAATATRVSVSENENGAVAPPYQQVRTAVAEAIVNATSNQKTDYVSLYADRPTTSHLTLKTLEISLEPADLGRVHVKMNLASRDLKLEIEASKATTAQMLANEQAALKRELLSDNAELSTVLVSVTSAVTDLSSASGTASGDQQFSGYSRTANENAFASTTGDGRDDRRTQKQPSSLGVANQPSDVELDSAGARGAGKELYI